MLFLSLSTFTPLLHSYSPSIYAYILSNMFLSLPISTFLPTTVPSSSVLYFISKLTHSFTYLLSPLYTCAPLNPLHFPINSPCSSLLLPFAQVNFFVSFPILLAGSSLLNLPIRMVCSFTLPSSSYVYVLAYLIFLSFINFPE